MTALIDSNQDIEINENDMPLIPSDENIVVTLENYNGPDIFFHESWILEYSTNKDDDKEVIDILSNLIKTPDTQYTSIKKTHKIDNNENSAMKKQKIVHGKK
jgi:hypothetical protein